MLKEQTIIISKYEHMSSIWEKFVKLAHTHIEDKEVRDRYVSLVNQVVFSRNHSITQLQGLRDYVNIQKN
ncbi:hypothetical protein CN918_29510 [Priestia megaterium]|nr:hypothetical protein CN918_29510 [Priestia megaterium]